MTTASLIRRTRMIVQDTGMPFAATVPIDGTSTVFDMPVESISNCNPLTVVLDGNIISPPGPTPQYVIDYKYGIISFMTAPQPAGAILGVQGTTYSYFDDDEVLQAVIDSFQLHTADTDPQVVMNPIPGQTVLPVVEEYPVALLAASELLWYMATDASQQVDIHTPEGVSIPRSERFRQTKMQIDALQQEYKDLCAALGVGLWRIQVLFQRRVSLTTNRLVPLFREQEYNQPYTGFWPTAGLPGTIVAIYGQWLATTSQITFGGVPADPSTIVVISDTEVQAIVPPDALTGQIGITTQGGSVLTTAQFVVGEPAPFVLYGPEQVKPPIPSGY